MTNNVQIIVSINHRIHCSFLNYSLLGRETCLKYVLTKGNSQAHYKLSIEYYFRLALSYLFHFIFRLNQLNKDFRKSFAYTYC